MGRDKTGLLKLLHVLSLTAVKAHNDFQRNRDYFCSELCYAAFWHGGVDIVPQIGEADITSPGDISQSPVLEKVGG